jgi:fibronectin type 3 domain-containing protein
MEKALELRWSPPSRSHREGAPPAVSAYRVYRSRTGEPGSFRVRGETELPTYVEADFQFGNTYFFKVRAVLRQSGQVAESEDSSIVEVTPRDIFPPLPPTGLTALYTGGAVELLWTASLELDLAGYNVYRRTEGDSLRRANDVLLRTPIFRDLSVAPDRRYFYRVTAVDLAKNESPPSAEVEVASR